MIECPSTMSLPPGSLIPGSPKAHLPATPPSLFTPAFLADSDVKFCPRTLIQAHLLPPVTHIQCPPVSKPVPRKRSEHQALHLVTISGRVSARGKGSVESSQRMFVHFIPAVLKSRWNAPQVTHGRLKSTEVNACDTEQG